MRNRDLTDPQRLQELFEENLAGVSWYPILGQDLYSSVVVVDLDLVGISVLSSGTRSSRISRRRLLSAIARLFRLPVSARSADRAGWALTPSR